MSDDDATNLIASYIPADWTRLYPSPVCVAKSAFLPAIHFASEEPDLNPTVTDPVRLQRIVACGAGSDASLEQRRTAKYELAAELNETLNPTRINKDCSADGCPGVHYSCNATGCVGTDSVPAGVSYVASYGQSQFIGATLVGQLISNYANFTPAQQTTLGLGPTSLTDLRAASTRATKMNAWIRSIAALPVANYADAATAWDNLPAATKAQFTADTGLGEQAYEDIVRMKTRPPTKRNGDSLLRDARQGFVTEAIMSAPGTKTLLMGINKGFDRFAIITQLLMRKNLNTVLARFPSAGEEEIAARVARLHNGGRGSNWDQPLATITGAGPRNDLNDYVKRFLGIQHSEGEWRSLRCTQDFGSTVQTLASGTDGKGIGGLQFTALQLR